MSEITEKPQEILPFGEMMSLASFSLENAKRAEVGTKERDAAISIAAVETFELNKFVSEQESFFEKVIRVILNIFGYVTDYQKLINEIDTLESEIRRMENEEVDYLKKVEALERKKQKKLDAQIKIGEGVNRLSKEFNEIEEAILTLKSDAEKLTSIDAKFYEIQELVNFYRNIIQKMNQPLDGLAKIYNEEINEFELIPAFYEKHQTAKDAINDIAAKLDELILPKASTPLPKTTEIGGIRNGGNTCYLASALQILNHTPIYRDLFDASINELSQKDNETEESFEQRQEIQGLGFAILEKISKGQTVQTNEINTFRAACFNHYIDPDTRVIDRRLGQVDAVETLGRLLKVLEYHEPLMHLTIKDEIVDEQDFKEINPVGNVDYETYEEAQEPKSEELTLTLPASSYQGFEVSMSQLFDDFWSDEEINEYKVFYVSNELRIREYQNVRRKKQLDIENSRFPKVLRVTIPQLNGPKARICGPEVIYPSGVEGVGPRYRLVGAIEHRPGHYVAHLNTPDGMIEANDGWVHSNRTSSFPGYGYFYALDNSP